MHRIRHMLKAAILAPFWLLMGLGGGSQSSSNTSRPLNAAERYSALAGALGALSGKNPKFSGGEVSNADEIINAASKKLMGLGSYDAPQTYDPGAAKTLTNGDYNKLQSDLLAGNTAGLDRAKSLDLQNTDSAAAKRGIWSSGLAMKAANDVSERYAPQYAAAGANATQQRYNLQSGDNQAANTYAANRSQLMAQQAQANSQNQYNAKWAPYNFLKDTYNGTGGTISNGSSSGWNANFSI